VQVLLGRLLAMGTEAQVLNCPRQPRGRRSERKHLANDLELFAGLSVDVDLAGFGLDDDLPAARGVAQAIALGRAHGRDFIGALPGRMIGASPRGMIGTVPEPRSWRCPQ